MNLDIINKIETGKSVDNKQLQVLHDLAGKSRDIIVEMGSYNGRSTVALAVGAGGRKVYAIDWWENVRFTDFWNNMIACGVDDVVCPIRSKSEDVILKPDIGLLFLDGSKQPLMIQEDLKRISCVSRGGYIAIHDYGTSRNITSALEEYIQENKNLIRVSRHRNLIIFKKGG